MQHSMYWFDPCLHEASHVGFHDLGIHLHPLHGGLGQKMQKPQARFETLMDRQMRAAHTMPSCREPSQGTQQLLYLCRHEEIFRSAT